MCKKFLDRRKRATEFEAKRRRLPKAGRRFVFSIKVKPLSSLFSLSSGKRMKTGRKAIHETERARRSSWSYLSVCVCVRVLLSSLVMCSVSQTSKKVRVCKNYEDKRKKAPRQKKEIEKRQKSGKTKRRSHSLTKKKKQKVSFLFLSFTLSRFALLCVIYNTRSRKYIYTQKRWSTRERRVCVKKKTTP